MPSRIYRPGGEARKSLLHECYLLPDAPSMRRAAILRELSKISVAATNFRREVSYVYQEYEITSSVHWQLLVFLSAAMMMSACGGESNGGNQKRGRALTLWWCQALSPRVQPS